MDEQHPPADAAAFIYWWNDSSLPPWCSTIVSSPRYIIYTYLALMLMRPGRGVLKLLRGTTLISIKYKKRSNRNKYWSPKQPLWRKPLAQNVAAKCLWEMLFCFVATLLKRDLTKVIHFPMIIMLIRNFPPFYWGKKHRHKCHEKVGFSVDLPETYTKNNFKHQHH